MIEPREVPRRWQLRDSGLVPAGMRRRVALAAAVMQLLAAPAWAAAVEAPPGAAPGIEQPPGAALSNASSAEAAPGGTLKTGGPRGAAPAGPPPDGAPETGIPSSGALPDGVSAGMPVWKLLVVDARSVLTAPARWDGRDWAIFGASVAGVAALTLSDKHLRTEALAGDAPLETTLANDFRYFGNYAAFGVLGAFYAGGALAHDRKAQETALDGLIASIIAGGVITTVLKEVTGRSRPSTHRGVYDFHPFSGNASFPSGETTEAFAVGSVIATQYPHWWVDVASYGTASLVAFARMREDGHFASDVTAGALIGTVVGRAVVHLNRRLRARLAVAPIVAPDARGVTFRAAF